MKKYLEIYFIVVAGVFASAIAIIMCVLAAKMLLVIFEGILS